MVEALIEARNTLRNNNQSMFADSVLSSIKLLKFLISVNKLQEENEEDGDEEDEREYDSSFGEWSLNLDGMVSDERGNGYDENGNWEYEWREQLNAVEIEDRVEESPIVMENSDPHQFPVTEECDDCHSLDHGDVVSREYTNSVEYQDVSSMSDQRYSFISCQNHL